MYDDAHEPVDPSAAQRSEAPDADESAGTHPAAPHESVHGGVGVPAGGHVAEHPAAGADAAVAEHTGHPAVDAVLASLAVLEASPVADHVVVFDNAHDALRRALGDAGED